MGFDWFASLGLLLDDVGCGLVSFGFINVLDGSGVLAYRIGIVFRAY